MSRHEGVSCDSCLKGNFRGLRYKCLICYDYDLCATCYESGGTTARHSTEHSMQCILTRTDFDLYYGGEALSADQPQSFTCSYCNKMGFTELTLLDHVRSDHNDAVAEVVCPICAALPSGDPNYVTDDLTAHLAIEHRAPREIEEPMGGIRHVRRIPHPGRGVSGPRARRTNMHFQSTAAGNALSGLAASSRETMDPIAELLSQISSVRSRASAAQSVSSQLQQLEMQLQTTRQQLERLPRRGESSRSIVNGNQTPAPILDFAAVVAGGSNNNPSGSSSGGTSQYLLARSTDSDLSESERQTLEIDRADRSAFVQELLLSSLADNLRLDSDSDEFEFEGDLDMRQNWLSGAVGRGQINDVHDGSSRRRNDSPNHGLVNGPTQNDVILHAPSEPPNRDHPDGGELNVMDVNTIVVHLSDNNKLSDTATTHNSH